MSGKGRGRRIWVGREGGGRVGMPENGRGGHGWVGEVGGVLMSCKTVVVRP